MNIGRRVLVVEPNPFLAQRLATWLSSQGHETHVCAGFEEAKPELDSWPPDLLVTEVKLGEFNGLHLAIRAKQHRPQTQALVLGEDDRFFAREAHQHGASYLAAPLDEQAFTAATAAMLSDGGSRRASA